MCGVTCAYTRSVIEISAWPRGLATRYEKRVVTYRAMAVIASIVISLDF
jgi:hypothetical protein